MEAQAPALRRVAVLLVQVRDRVRVFGFGGGDVLAAVVGELGDLVGEHLGDGGGLEDLARGGGGGAGVEEGG